MTKTEWMERYAARIMYRAEWDKESAVASADAIRTLEVRHHE